MNSTASAEVAPLIQLAHDAQATSYVAIAGLTVLVLDHVMTFREEIDLMWHSKWSLTKILYLWNRYFSLAALLFDAHFYVSTTKSDILCQAFVQVQGLAATIIVATVDLVLLLRVYVLYNRSRKVLFFLIPLVLCEVIPMAIISIFSDLPLKQFAHLGPSFHGCYSLVVPRFLTVYAVPALVASTVMFAMTIRQCGFSAFSDGRQMPVIKLFARDGVIWFSAVLAITAVNISIWAALRPTMAETNIAMSCALYSIIASRVLLNIKTTLQSTDNLSTLKTIPATELIAFNPVVPPPSSFGGTTMTFATDSNPAK